jgi:hypothetical protein
MRKPALSIALLIALATPASAADEVKVKGYAEYNSNGALIVEGQVVRAFGNTKFKGDNIDSIGSIPLGYEVEAKGDRQSDGTIVAREIKAKPNGDSMFEGDVLDATNEIEQEWVRQGRMYEPTESGEGETIGRLLTRGSYVDRANRIMRRLTPPYVDFDRQVRVHVVETQEWNAAAMGNGAIWVYTGLMDSMTDDELSMVLGHEMAHYTHEHSRRQAKSGMWQGVAALGAILAGEVIGTDTSRTAAGIASMIGMTVWGSGYSRDLEDQADRVGLRYANEGGYNVAAGVSLWAKFREKYGEPDKVTNFFLGSHSRPSDRIRNIQEQIALNYPERAGEVESRVAVGGFDLPTPGPDRSPPESPPTTESNAWVEQVQAQLVEFATQLPADFVALDDAQYFELETRVTDTHEIRVRPGEFYVILGACDNDCTDIDLAIFNPKGESIATDYEPDDFPVLSFDTPKGGRWSLEVSIPACKAESCVYGFQVYRRR